MKIALIHCPFGHKVCSENLKVVDEEFCLAPPISLAYVAGILERSGHEVILLDAHALKLSKEKVIRILRYFNPGVIGLRIDTYQFHNSLEWIKYLKQYINVPIVVGGINLSFYPKETLSYPEVDYGIIGEATESLPKLISAIESTTNDVSSIEGIVYKDNGQIKINYPSQKYLNFDSYPFPARHLLPNNKYYSFTSQRKNFTIMVTSKGCPYKCTFCAISKLPYVERSVENIISEIEECYYKYNIREIDFFDATFFYNKKKSIQICEEIIKRKIKIEWSCRSRVDLVYDELLKIAFMAGCRKIYYGIESANHQILKNINKNIDISQIKEAIFLSRKYNINTLGFFMLGSPGETIKSIKETIQLSKQLKLDFIQVCKTIAKPGTDLHQDLNKGYNVDFWREYVIGGISDKPFPNPWTSLTHNEIEKYLKKTYLSFYLRPQCILKTLLRIKSFKELIRYISVGFKMIIN